jgi:hypothetical protein
MTRPPVSDYAAVGVILTATIAGLASITSGPDPAPAPPSL